MAEEILIGELNIDVDELTAKLIALNRRLKEQKEELTDLEAAQKSLREEGKSGTDQYKENAASIEVVKANIKGLSTDYRNNQKVLTDVVATETAQLGTLQRLALENKQLREEQKKLNLETAEGEKRNDEINKTINANTSFIKAHSDALAQDKMNVGNYKSALDALPPSFKGIVTGIQSATKASLAFLATPIGVVIGLVVAGVSLLIKGFTNSQKAMDIFRQTTESVTAAFKVFADRLSNFVEGVLSIFNKELRESRKEAKALEDEMLGIDESMSRREKRQLRKAGKKGLLEEIRDEAKAAGELTKAMQVLEDKEIAYMTTKANLQKQVEEYRLAVKDENKTQRERLDGLDKAIAIEKQMILQEVEFAKERARISQERTDQGNSTREELKENEELQAKAIQIETDGIKRINAIASERLGIINGISAEESKAITEREAEYKKELDFFRNLNKEFKQAAEDRTDIMLDEIMGSLDAEIEAMTERNERLEEYEMNRVIHNIESERMLREQAAENDFERRQIQLDHQRQAEVEAAEKMGADVSLINKRYALMQVELERQVQNQKLSVYAGFAGAIGSLFGKQTVAAKIAAVAQATINTYLGATAAFAQTPGGIIIKSLAAASAVASGLKSIKEILKVKAPGGGGGSMPSASGLTSSGTNPVISSDGGLTSRNLTNDNIGGMQTALSSAMKDQQPVLVVDAVTAKQSNANLVNATGRV